MRKASLLQLLHKWTLQYLKRNWLKCDGIKLSYQKIMCTSVEYNADLVQCNGQHISYQHKPVYGALGRKNICEDRDSEMERSELTLSFHNLIKRGRYFEFLIFVHWYVNSVLPRDVFVLQVKAFCLFVCAKEKLIVSAYSIDLTKLVDLVRSSQKWQGHFWYMYLVGSNSRTTVARRPPLR